MREGTARLYDFKDGVQLSISYELNRDRRTIRRKIYGILDFLGNIGGLAGSLKALFGLIIAIT